MAVDRRDRITNLYQQALSHAPDARGAFLKHACGDDEALRLEIESLLGYDAAGFLERPAVNALSTAVISSGLVGRHVGPYEVVAPLGAGGMGEVYRARDTRLGRDVAIKLLPSHLTADSERRARFAREARLLATLSHPNIGAIYGLEQADGVDALVLELVEGPTLAERLADDAMTLSEALTIAHQLAEALEAAHAHGIVHRDLKPANIVLQSPTGAPRVKVLDFGLGKALTDGAGVSISDSFDGTADGRILGTPAYMSPEQVRGQAVDKRTDIWAFGCVLFEMLAARPPFAGPTISETFVNILEREPDWTALPTETPAGIRVLIQRCLRRDPQSRLHDIADARIEIDEANAAGLSGAARAMESGRFIRTPTRGKRWRALAAMASGVIGLAIGATVWRTAPPDAQVVRAIWDVSPAEEVGSGSTLGVLPGGSRTSLAWSPDGRTLAFIGIAGGVRKIYLRDLDGETARPLDGTENARSLAFSPDGTSIAFFADGALRQVRVSGGTSSTIGQVPPPISGISWGASRIVYATSNRLFAVSPEGGEPQALYESSLYVSSPILLPGDTAVLFTEYDRLWTSGNERVLALSLSPQARPKVLIEQAADPRYLSTGRVAFLRQGTVFVAPFNTGALEIRGGATAVLNGVAQAVAAWAGTDLTLAGQYAISSRGALAYLAGAPQLPTSELVAVSRRGAVTPLGTAPAVYRPPVQISPDGTSVAFSLHTARDRRLLIFNLVRKTVDPLQMEPADREVFAPRWSHDGRIATSVVQGGRIHLEVLRPGSAAAPQRIDGSEGFMASSWSRDGERLVGLKGGDIWVHAMHNGKTGWTQVTRTQATERYASWSPDDRWLVYVSNITGDWQVYVQEEGAPASAVPVSINGGIVPVWNPKGGELFYIEGHPLEDDELDVMAAEMSNPRRPGRPVRLFSVSTRDLLFGLCNPYPCYSVSPDGQAFYTLRTLPRQPVRVTQIRFVSNWLEEVQRLLMAPSP